MEHFIKDESDRLEWLRDKINSVLPTWISNDNLSGSLVDLSIYRKLINRMIDFEIDYLNENPQDYIELYYDDIAGGELHILLGIAE